MGVAERMRVEDLWETHIDVPIVSNLKKKNNTVKIVSPGVKQFKETWENCVFVFQSVYVYMHTYRLLFMCFSLLAV